jgi:hypothetical protein
MKVLQNIIEYLLQENKIKQDDYNYLQQKGFYVLDYDDLDFYDDGYWRIVEQENEDYWKYYEEDYNDIEFEPSLADKRRRKQGRRARFEGPKRIRRAA